LVTTWPIQTMV